MKNLTHMANLSYAKGFLKSYTETHALNKPYLDSFEHIISHLDDAINFLKEPNEN